MLQTFRKCICLVKDFFLIFFLRNIVTSFTAVTSQNTTHFWYFFIILSICCCHLIVYYLTKPLWNCLSAYQICCSRCCIVCLVHCQYGQWEGNFNLQIPHDDLCRRSLTIQSRSLKLYFISFSVNFQVTYQTSYFFEIVIFLNSCFSEHLFFTTATYRSSHQRYSGGFLYIIRRS